jgi:hypothetical protein
MTPASKPPRSCAERLGTAKPRVNGNKTYSGARAVFFLHFLESETTKRHSRQSKTLLPKQSKLRAIPITNAQCHAWAQTLSPRARLWGDVILFAILAGLLVLVLL